MISNKENKERNQEIFLLFKNGMIKAEIGRKYNLSNNRIGQIIAKKERMEKETMKTFPKYDNAGNRYEGSWCKKCGEEECYRILTDNNRVCHACNKIEKSDEQDCKWLLSNEEKEIVLDFRWKKYNQFLQQRINE